MRVSAETIVREINSTFTIENQAWLDLLVSEAADNLNTVSNSCCSDKAAARVTRPAARQGFARLLVILLLVVILGAACRGPCLTRVCCLLLGGLPLLAAGLSGNCNGTVYNAAHYESSNTVHC